ncbi:PhoH family protein [Heyndrickxia oleronia]|jgi:phosphate starvation-inducible protein PhoH|uniref:PhoH family protein n=1 Tax=Heyndrickxia oleronia TaxID=38875 RepID=UPI00242FB09A|nr:PhoH family protein [Heyndrickxia oleronia]MCI1763658.1 PhoH family protein [Heyndrickxia oleronia]
MPLPKDHLFFNLGSKLTNEQKEYVDSIFDNQFTIVNAKAGTGKTTLAVAVAKLLSKDLYYIFSPVEERTMGFRPGDQREKEASYITPLKDALLEINESPERVIYDPDKPELLKRGEVWVYPMSHVFARGMNLKNATIIIDEAQNFTRGELKKILTRIHDDCTVIMIGHDGQNDLSKPEKSGFLPYIEHFKNEPYVKICKLTHNFRGKLATHADELSW